MQHKGHRRTKKNHANRNGISVSYSEERRRSPEKYGGSGPKVRKIKTAKIPTPETKVPTPETKVPTLDECPLCMEPMPTNTMLTSCKHKFHKNCLIRQCNSGRDKVCALCRKPIVYECMKIGLPNGQFMPPGRQEKIIKYEKQIANMLDGQEMAAAKEKRMTSILKLLKFPKSFGTTEWNKINHFSEAANRSLFHDSVFETVLPMAIEMERLDAIWEREREIERNRAR